MHIVKNLIFFRKFLIRFIIEMGLGLMVVFFCQKACDCLIIEFVPNVLSHQICNYFCHHTELVN